MIGTAVRVRGIKRYFEPKAGRWYCYHRATGERITEDFGTAAFFERVTMLDRRAEGLAGERAQCRKGTLHALILAYRADERYTDLAPRTKADYERCFAFFEAMDYRHLSEFTHESLVETVDKWKPIRGRRFVNYCVTVLRLLFAFAKAKCFIATNPMLEVEGVRKPRNARVWNRPWTAEERLAAWERTGTPRWSHLRLPFALALFAGMRCGDVIRLPKSAMKAGQITHCTAKRGVWIDLDLANQPDLARALRDAAPHDAMTLIADRKGQPYNENRFKKQFFAMVAELEKEGLLFDGCTFHGLRHSLAHTIAESEEGYDEADIAAVLGQRSSASARVYTVRADRQRRAKKVIANIKPLRRK